MYPSTNKICTCGYYIVKYLLVCSLAHVITLLYMNFLEDKITPNTEKQCK